MSKRSVGPGKPLALITCLAFAPQRRATRDTLCDLLWGDRGLELGRPSLRQTLWLIKTQIDPDLVEASAASVALSSAIESDAHEFAAAIEAGDLQRAIDLYSGDFFIGYGAPGAGRFEEWASLERARFRALFTNAAEVLARQSLDSGRFADTIALARRLRTVDPHGQIGWRMLLEARMASGDHIGTLATAEHFSEWLRQEEWDPEPASLLALHTARHVAEPEDGNGRAVTLVSELVGREREFAAIHHAWTIARTKGSRIVRIVGDSGLGKTRLTRDIAARIRAGRGRARYARANYGERNIPFSFAAAVAELLANVRGAGGVAPAAARTLVALNPALSSQYSESPSTPERLQPLRVGLALLELISAVADEEPIALVLDDMHWCDAASRAALTVVASRLKRQNVLLLLTMRPIYASDTLPGDSLEFRLARLAPAEVGELVTSLGRLPETAWARELPARLCSATRGNPFQVLESLRLCLDTGLLSRSDDEWSCADPAVLLQSFDQKATVDGRLAALSPVQRSILLMLGIVGLPAARDIIARAAVTGLETAAAAAAELEIRGLLIAENDTWALAHDSIGESLIGQAEAAMLKEAQARLGEAMAASDDAHWQRKAILHLAEGGLWERVAESAIPLLRRSTSHSAEVNAQLSSLLGLAAKAEVIASVRRRLPFSVRRPEILRRGISLGAVAAVGTAALFAFSEIASRNKYEVAITVLNNASSGFEIRSAALNFESWNPLSPLTLGSAQTLPSNGSRPGNHATSRPGSETWASYATYPDSGQGDIVLIDRKGTRVRLTRSPGEDRPTSFSPDGKQLLYLTTRWSTAGWSDVAVLDMTTLSTRRLTRDDGPHQFPRWSPDGTRISFTRSHPENDSSNVCVVDADGYNGRCLDHPAWRLSDQAGWLDAHRLLILADSSAGPLQWVAFDVDRGRAVRTAFPTDAEVTLDPTGAWALIQSRIPGERSAKVAPASQFDLARFVVQDPQFSGDVWFTMPNASSSFLDSIAVLRPPGPLAPRVPHQLRPLGWSKGRRSLSPAAVRWRSLTPSIASIDSLGVLVARTTGRVVIELSAGGWRTTRDTIQVSTATSDTLVDERWDSTAFSRWRFFGNPLPVLKTIGNRHTFYNNGDGHYFSGAYLPDGVAVDRGAAMDIEVSTPVNRTQWQIMLFALHSVRRPHDLKRWDHRNGYMSDFVDGDVSCMFAYPAGEGQRATRTDWLSLLQSAIGDSSYRVDTGEWYRVRLQVFPDGRCGMAINGHPLRIAPGNGTWQTPAHPVIQGNSVGTRMLVGRVTITSGTPADIDWTSLKFDGTYWTHQAGPKN